MPFSDQTWAPLQFFQRFANVSARDECPGGAPCLQLVVDDLVELKLENEILMETTGQTTRTLEMVVIPSDTAQNEKFDEKNWITVTLWRLLPRHSQGHLDLGHTQCCRIGRFFKLTKSNSGASRWKIKASSLER